MALDDRMKIVKKTFTKEQLEAMSAEDLIALVGMAGANAKFTGTAVVRRADGSIKYDDDATPGEYMENQ